MVQQAQRSASPWPCRTPLLAAKPPVTLHPPIHPSSLHSSLHLSTAPCTHPTRVRAQPALSGQRTFAQITGPRQSSITGTALKKPFITHPTQKSEYSRHVCVVISTNSANAPRYKPPARQYTYLRRQRTQRLKNTRHEFTGTCACVRSVQACVWHVSAQCGRAQGARVEAVCVHPMHLYARVCACASTHYWCRGTRVRTSACGVLIHTCSKLCRSVQAGAAERPTAL